MNVIYDNIIFSLQNHGGVSVVWSELQSRLLTDSDIELKMFRFNKVNQIGRINKDQANLFLRNNLDSMPITMQRYFSPKVNVFEDFIFHSSYYRVCNQKNALNVTTVHDFTYELFVSGVSKLIHKVQKTNAINRSKKIICVSKNTKNDLLRFHPKVNESDIYVVYNGVSSEYGHLEICNSRLPETFPYKKNEFLLYVGDRRAPYKNFKIAVETCGKTNYPMVIVGGGTLNKDEITLLNTVLKPCNYVSLVGLSNVELNRIYNNAAFLLYPSLYEGFGIPIVEAQRAGCPVICANSSSIPEVAGDAAFLINEIDSDKISDIIISSKSRSGELFKIINSGYENSKRFSWDNCYKGVKDVYKSI